MFSRMCFDKKLQGSILKKIKEKRYEEGSFYYVLTVKEVYFFTL
jgi:hypothetical protein